MKILVISPYLPWPLKTGGNVAMFSTLQCLSEDHQFTLVCPVTAGQIQDMADLQVKLPKLHLRGVICPVAGQESLLRRGLSRLSRMLRLFERVVHEEGRPWDPFGPIPPFLIDVIHEELSLCPDVCQVEFVEMMSVSSLLPKSIPSIFIHHQIHFVYNDLTWNKQKQSIYCRYLTSRQRLIETAYLREYSALISFSKDDRTILGLESNMPPIYDSAFPVPADVGITNMVPTEFNGRFCFLGSQEHQPNREGLDWLLDEIWPLIVAKLAKPELVIFGAWNDSWQEKSEYCGGTVTFPGFVQDLGGALCGGILLVPLRVGSGIRTKILAGLAQGVPCVATTIAAEGLPTGSEGGVIRADETAKFVDAAVDLATRPETWKVHADAGPEYVSKFHSPEAVRRRRNEIYVDVVEAHQAKDGVL